MTLLERLKTIVTFMARRDNPNVVTAVQAGTMTRTEIEALANTKVRNGTLPIFRYGTLDDIAVGFTANGFVLTITENQPLFINGTEMTIAAGSVNVSQYPNTTVYVTAELVQGIPTYKYYSLKPADSSTLINMGTLTTGGAGITHSSIYKARGIIPFYVE